MQNRGMFPYRRHGGKKRSKGPSHKSRGSHRPLPNSARDLLPMLQPATKALAQMLAGRAGVSGQLNHARNLLAHAERLINDRVHNRLIPAEREEFFEQLARLRLTLADADAEAEVQAAEEQVEKEPPRPVAQERLKEMALALSRPERDRSLPPRSADEPDDSGPELAAMPGDRTKLAAAPGEEALAAPAPAEQPERPLRSLDNLPGRLVLSKPASDKARSAIVDPVVTSRRRSRRLGLGATPAAEVPDSGEPERDAPGPDTAPDTGNGASATANAERRAVRRARKTKDGLPEGWVIDEEGFVVPRHG
jgi:hypothetical protein